MFLKTRVSFCRRGWPWTGSNLPVSIFQVLGHKGSRDCLFVPGPFPGWCMAFSCLSSLWEMGRRERRAREWEAHSLLWVWQGGNEWAWVCFPWGTKAAALQITHSCSLLWRKRAHANEVISSLNYEKYTVGRRKVKSKRRWHLEGPDTWAPMLTRIIKT